MPSSPLATEREAWSLEGDTLIVVLDKAPELDAVGGALRLEDEALPDRLLLVHGHDDAFHAYANHCACGGFRIDPVPGESKIRCCTLAQSTYDYDGNVLGSHPPKGLTVYPVERAERQLAVDLATPRVGRGAKKK